MAHTYDIKHKNWHVFCFFFSQLNLYSFLIGNKNKIYVKIPWKNILGKLILFFFLGMVGKINSESNYLL